VSQDSGRYWGLNSLQARESYKTGPYEYKLASYIRYIAMKMEAETTEEFFVAFGDNTWPSYRNMTDGFIRLGDMIFADNIQVFFNGYLTCHYRAFFCAEKKDLTKEMKEGYRRVRG
jgi:exopolysaccharide biosynthesis predicted pyruvyltransferase EpsI